MALNQCQPKIGSLLFPVRLLVDKGSGRIAIDIEIVSLELGSKPPLRGIKLWQRLFNYACPRVHRNVHPHGVVSQF